MVKAKKKNVWFRPARFWGVFAFYYPSSRQGWLATIILVTFLVCMFLFIDQRSHSSSDTLIAFAPWLIAVFAIFDTLCFRFGEYPAWWKR